MKPQNKSPLLAEADSLIPRTRSLPPSSKKKIKDPDKDSCCPYCITQSGAMLTMLVVLFVVLAFTAGTILGLILMTTPNPLVTRYFYQPHNASSNSSLIHDNTVYFTKCDAVASPKNINDLEAFLSPTSVFHNMTDKELLWRASMAPRRIGVDLPFHLVPKIAFLFLSRGNLPLAPLWDRFFLTAPSPDRYSIYIHAPPGSNLSVPLTSAFHGRQIPSEWLKWGSISLVDAERRLLANALLDYHNERFVLLSESCIPVFSFNVVYDYLLNSSIGAFVESYDENSGKGRGRYRAAMAPDIVLRDWRKGSQWFELGRDLATTVVAETRYIEVFRRTCFPDCYPDEHYLPTYLQMFQGEKNANRTVTWVDWSRRGPHPGTYGRIGAEGRDRVTPELVKSIRESQKGCDYRGNKTSVCYMFARKFDPAALETLLSISTSVMGY